MELQVFNIYRSLIRKHFDKILNLFFLVNKVSFNKQMSESEQANIFYNHTCENEKVCNT